jgi:hypothetical protein
MLLRKKVSSRPRALYLCISWSHRYLNIPQAARWATATTGDQIDCLALDLGPLHWPLAWCFGNMGDFSSSLLPTRDGPRGLTAIEPRHDALQFHQDGITPVPCSQWRRPRHSIKSTSANGLGVCSATKAGKPYRRQIASTCLIEISMLQAGSED